METKTKSLLASCFIQVLNVDEKLLFKQYQMLCDLIRQDYINESEKQALRGLIDVIGEYKSEGFIVNLKRLRICKHEVVSTVIDKAAKRYRNSLDGAINFIDEVQDYAVEKYKFHDDEVFVLLKEDKNGKMMDFGTPVLVPEPNGTDIHNNEFQGSVRDFRNGNVVVEDAEGNCYEIEPERLEVTEE